VINPASGPGPGSIPDANYTREIPLLNAYANVRTVGYVSTDYARRDLRSILRDIDLYSGWAEVTTADLSVRGIFLDETPTQYDGASAECLGAVARHIQSAPALGKNPFVSWSDFHLHESWLYCEHNKAAPIYAPHPKTFKAALFTVSRALKTKQSHVEEDLKSRLQLLTRSTGHPQPRRDPGHEVHGPLRLERSV
jgi:hypothetical protein